MTTLYLIGGVLALTAVCSLIALAAFGIWVDYPTRPGATVAALLALVATGLHVAGLLLIRDWVS